MATRSVRNNITVSYEEVDPSPIEDMDLNTGFRATRHLKVAWNNRITLAREMLGWTESAGVGVLYHKPHPYPHYPAGIGVMPEASSVHFTGFGGSKTGADATLLAYDWCTLDVGYSIQPGGGAPEQDDPATETELVLADENLEPGGEFITVSRDDLFWDSGQTEKLDPTEAPSVLIGLVTWTYTKHNVPAIPESIFANVGKTNTGLFKSAGMNIAFGAETVLYIGPGLSRQITAAGPVSWELTLNLSVNWDGWNMFRKSGDTAPAAIYDENGDVFKPYPTADLLPMMSLEMPLE